MNVDRSGHSLVMKHTSQPGWGMGLVVQDLPPYLVLYFEHAGEKKFIKEKARMLVPVSATAPELARLQSKASHRRPRTQPRATNKARAAAAAKARFKSIEEQVAFFVGLFPGGFQGERYIAEERGPKGVTGKLGYKEAAMALAQTELSAAAFASGTPEVLFESAKRLLQATNIVFPIEGSIPFNGLDAAARTHALDALQNLLHGEGEYGERLQRFAGAVDLKDKSGEAKKVSWPFATLFGALFAPAEHTCVKPTPFASQAAMLGLPVERTQPVTGGGYRQFLLVATRTQSLLVAAGLKPRDLMDVYSFIWRTHAEKPGAGAAVEEVTVVAQA